MPHSHRLRDNRRMEAAGTWFVTKSLWPKKLILVSKDLARIIVDSLAYRSIHDHIPLAAFVVMPDHWHALFAIPVGAEGHADTLPAGDAWSGYLDRQSLSRGALGREDQLGRWVL